MCLHWNMAEADGQGAAQDALHPQSQKESLPNRPD